MHYNRAKFIVIDTKLSPCLQMGADQGKTVHLERFQQPQQTNIQPLCLTPIQSLLEYYVQLWKGSGMS